ncbi:hypothetical protein TIFTF001_033838 [Ficus carica]|uniref:Uncharacterized protein n=1 Tax=Ficus carica TaxID=3494 RepID=A0AA88J8D0_FICCA|nr:hypothetical protein TIFTF001_033838 [Ficus carica]
MTYGTLIHGINEGKGKELVKEADEVKLDAAEDTNKVEMEHQLQKQESVYEYGTGIV